MGWYSDQVLPRLVDRLCARRELVELRRQAMEGLEGTVVEIGFGSGLNLPLYPARVAQVKAVEPSRVAVALARRRLATSPVPVEVVGEDAHALPLADQSVDAALSTFTLCTVADPDRVAREVWRVLRPGGRFHVLEHGRSGDPHLQRWQHRIEPLNRHLAGGCHLTRDHWHTLEAAGFELEQRRNEQGPRPKTQSAYYLGVARRPSSGGASEAQ